MPSPLLFFFERQLVGLFVWQWLGIVAALGVGQLVGRLLSTLLSRMAGRLAKRTIAVWDDVIVAAVHTPARAFCIALATYLPIRTLQLPQPVSGDISAFVHATCIAIVGWALIRAMHATAYALGDLTAARETNDPERLTRARSLRTQIILANRLGSVVIFFVVGSIVALQFNGVRAVGISLLASAGVAGVVLGFAAQKSLGTLFAGIQLSMSQPVRMGDNVTLDGEFGTIEDIGLTYVTVRLGDERRLIVPTPRLLDQPLQNWSRTTNGLTGHVVLKLALEIPVDAARAEFERIITREPLWDGNVRSVQVTDAGERIMELRFLMSARTPTALSELRVAVREKLVLWLQRLQGVHLTPAHVALAAGDHVKPVSEH